MRHARWRSAEAGGVLVEPGRRLPKVLMLLEGKAVVRKAPGAPPAARFYEGRHERGELKQRSTGGCIIGGTALVDPAVLGRPYPNQARASGHSARGPAAPRALLPWLGSGSGRPWPAPLGGPCVRASPGRSGRPAPPARPSPLRTLRALSDWRCGAVPLG